MKKTNKGFSMVELIIVIAIMAILAGALAPALIKYINKSRLSTDIQTGQTIATAIQTALTNEDAFDAAPDTAGTPTAITSWFTGTDAFCKEFQSAMGTTTEPKGKAKKDLDGCDSNLSVTGTGDFLVDIQPTGNVVKVYRHGTNDYEVYPNVDKTHMAK